MISRRQFLLGTTAAIAATALPKREAFGVDWRSESKTYVAILHPTAEQDFFEGLYWTDAEIAAMEAQKCDPAIISRIGQWQGVKLYEADRQLTCEELYDRLKADLKRDTGKETPWTSCHLP